MFVLIDLLACLCFGYLHVVLVVLLVQPFRSWWVWLLLHFDAKLFGGFDGFVIWIYFGLVLFCMRVCVLFCHVVCFDCSYFGCVVVYVSLCCGCLPVVMLAVGCLGCLLLVVL